MATINAANEPTAASGTVLQGQGVGTASAFSTATYPATTTVSQILYSSATNTVAGLATANNGTLITGTTGIPSMLANGTTGQVLTATTGSPPSWTTVGGGDVTGPAGATTTAIAVYNGATGKIIANSVPTIDSNGNILTSASISGGTLSMDVVNSSNTASSVARMSTTVAGSSAGDATFQTSVSGGQAYTWGIDNSVSSPQADPFVLSSGVSLGTNNTIVVQPAGQINYPLQPLFVATLAGDLTNVTGDATNYTVVFDTEVKDQNSNFNGTTTFTAPVTGTYLFLGSILIANIGAAHTLGFIQLVTTSTTYNQNYINPFTTAFVAQTTISLNQFAVMTAGDTATLNIVVAGSTKTIGITGNTAAAATVNQFSCFLLG